MPGINPNPLKGPPGPVGANGPNLPPRAPPMIMEEVPRRAVQPDAGRPTETEAKYGTFNQRDFPEMTVHSAGYWWRRRFAEAGIISALQSEKRYDNIPCDPVSLHTQFLTSREE